MKENENERKISTSNTMESHRLGNNQESNENSQSKKEYEFNTSSVGENGSKQKRQQNS